MSLPVETDLNLLLNLPLNQLILKANKIREDFLGNKIELCSIINAKSGLCTQDCKFCAQSAGHSTNTPIYPLKTKGQIVKAAKKAKETGAEKFGIVTSGDCLTAEEIDVIAKAIYEIKDKVGIVVCASMGSLEKEQLRVLKEAGLSRYHHNIETSRRFYPRIVSTHSFDQRLNTIKAASQVGLEVCSGGIIGMGEDWQDRIEMACTLRDLEVDSIPINFLVPIKGTPFENLPLISCDDAIRTVCIFRIILKNKIVKIAAGRESILKDSQAAGFMAGANGMLIGGYLTIKGRDPESDRDLIKEIEKLWSK